MFNISTQPAAMLSNRIPYKSVAVALLFSVVLGPIGLLYASFWGGFFMIFVGIAVVSSKFLFPILLLWIICCIWSVGAVERYNKKILVSVRGFQRGEAQFSPLVDID